MKISKVSNKLIKKDFSFPLNIFSELEAKEIANKFSREFDNIRSHSLQLESKFKSHLIFKFLNDIIFDERILTHVKNRIGQNILCWNSIIFSKPKNSGKYVGWHRDKEYWGLDNDKVVTISIALTESTIENGCLKIYDGEIEDLNYEIYNDRNNLLARGQNAIIDEKSKKILNVELKPGQAAIFNQNVIHGSDRNNSNKDRILIAIRYISPDNRTINNHRTATLVSGKDEFNFYEKEPIPSKSFDEKILKFHSNLMAKQAMVFAKEMLSKYKLGFFANILRLRFVRGLYYKTKKMI